MEIFWEIHGYPLDLEIFLGLIMMSGLYQYGNKRGIVAKLYGNYFCFYQLFYPDAKVHAVDTLIPIQGLYLLQFGG